MIRRYRIRGSRSNRRNRTTIILCIVIEILVILLLGIMIFWNKGLSTWLSHFEKMPVKHVDISDIQSPYGVLISAQGGKVIGEKNADEIAFPASLTKIMTTIVAIEELKNLDQEITLQPEWFTELYARDATQAGFQPGEIVRARDLLYGVMLPSGAECCLGLANAIAGSEQGFVELMNKKAEKLGLRNTHFCDTTGLHDTQHYSSAFDMAVILKYALKNKIFREIAESPWHSTPGTNIHEGGITYYSSTFNGLPDPTVTGGKILGGKTGFTNEAGLCLASFAEIEGREYILVTMGANVNGANFEDAKMIYNRLGTMAME